MTSMRQVEAVTGVTVVSEENHLSPQRDDFSAAVGQREVDGGLDWLAVDAEELVGRGVAAGRVRAHAKAFRDRLEALGLFADARARAPPPCLVNERPVRRVHQADDAVVDVAGQVGGEVGGAEALARTLASSGMRELRARACFRSRAPECRPRRGRRALRRGTRWHRCGWHRGGRGWRARESSQRPLHGSNSQPW